MARKSPQLTVIGSASEPSGLPPPTHLGDAGRGLWSSIQGDYRITDPGGLALLQTACEAADRIASVRAQIDEQGELLVVKGMPRVHPLCAVERDQRTALARCIRYLNLDLEPLRDRSGRPAGR